MATLAQHRMGGSNADSRKRGPGTRALVMAHLLLTGCSGAESPKAPEHAPADTKTQPSEAPAFRFVDRTAECGVDFVHAPHRSDERYMPEILGSGVVIADFNRDGAPDLLFVNSGRLGAAERPSGAENRLYLNDGRGHFTDQTAEWKLPSAGYGMGGAAGDFDNDGLTDVYLTSFGGHDALLRNTGRGFEDVTAEARIIDDGRWSTAAGFLDLENDGDLDLYVVRYVDYEMAGALKCYFNDVHVYCTPVLFDATPDRLLRNRGDGTFEDISGELTQTPGKGLALTIGDIDLDGDVDVYVANDTTANHLLLNDGSGKLTDRALLSGVAYSEVGAEEAGMGSDFSDTDGDGRPDIACTNFQAETTSIYRQQPRMFFREVSDAIGVGRTARDRLSFGVDFFDADNDGDEDLLIANGHISDNVHLYSDSVTFAQRNTLYENRGGNFVDVTDAAGPAFEQTDVSRGLATADLDGDGDGDFVFTNNAGRPQIGINESPGGNFVGLWLEGRRANRSAIGARIEARVGQRTLLPQVLGASSYLSACDARVHLGLGQAAQVDELRIHWPGGEVQTISGLSAGRYYRIVEGNAPEAFTPGEKTFD